MKSEYIERKAAMTVPVLPKEYRTYRTANLDDAYEAGWNDALENLQNIPAEDVLPVECGTWIEDHDYLKCPRCGVMLQRDFPFFDIGKWKNFCPNCGIRLCLED